MSNLTSQQRNKHNKGLCIAYRCMNTHAKTRLYCHTHISQMWRKNNPLKAAYKAFKSNAKRRKKPFEITFEQFKEFALKTKLMKGRGKNKDSWHIDRIDEEKGYTIDNIQILTNSENVKKYLDYSYLTKHGSVRTHKTIENKDVPF